jgi:gamma-glutamyltranspeptidase
MAKTLGISRVFGGRKRRPTSFLVLALIAAVSLSVLAAGSAGVREAAWSPDGRRLAVTWDDVIWTMTPDGREARRLVAKPGGWSSERDAAWSPDGASIAFAANPNGEYDVFVAPAAGGAARRVTGQPGDERWPSWTRDGRLVFSHRAPRGAWQLFVASADGTGEPAKLTPDDAAEWQGRVSPDGKLVALISDRDAGDDSTDVWVRELPAKGASIGSDAKPRQVRVTHVTGAESYPAWAPDNQRVAYAAVRGGLAAIWVSNVPALDAPVASSGATGGGRSGRGRGAGGGPTGPTGSAGPADSTVLASRRFGVPAWSPDGQTLAIATQPNVRSSYNGDPRRNDDDAPMLFSDAKMYELWRVAAPRPIDDGARTVALPAPDGSRWTSAFDEVWQTLRSLYYRAGTASATAWEALRDKYRPKVAQATSAQSAEDAIDAMIAEQPLIKTGAESSRAVVTSGNPLASAAGAEILAKGGNIVDAAIAVDFALGVTEPDASSVGGDGMALLFLKGMPEPIAIDFKDMTPGHATNDNPKLFNATGGRIANDGPSVANIPGIVAGMDLLYQKYGSKKVPWADILAPAIKLADEGFILDEALPTTVAEGRASFLKYPETARVFMPGGKAPRPGDRFVNKDYAETLRTIAREGAQAFYRGSIAQRIAADMAANGGVITLEDLAQYHAVERQPLSGRYRGHLVYSAPPPVSNGAQMIETLQILDNYQPKPGASYANDADFLHYVIDAWRVRDGGVQIADPDHWPINLGNHLTPAHALDRFRLLDPKKAYVAQGGGRGGGPTGSTGPTGPTGPDPADGPEAPAGPDGRVESGTTSFALADTEGNMIVFTQTLSTWGGNYYVSKGLGFLYNDHFRGGGGRGGLSYGSMLPLMRSSSTSVPTMLFAPRAGGGNTYGIPGFAPKMAVGCAGNAWIPASVYNIITNVIDSGMDAQHAIEAPRLLIGNTTQIEDRIPRAILADLEARGHVFQKIGRKGEVREGYASVVVIDAATGRVQAGAEPRRSHGAVGVK